MLMGTGEAGKERLRRGRERGRCWRGDKAPRARADPGQGFLAIPNQTPWGPTASSDLAEWKRLTAPMKWGTQQSCEQAPCLSCNLSPPLSKLRRHWFSLLIFPEPSSWICSWQSARSSPKPNPYLLRDQCQGDWTGEPDGGLRCCKRSIYCDQRHI